MSINIYRLDDMDYTPFVRNSIGENTLSNQQFLLDHRIQFGDSHKDCDLYIKRIAPGIKKRILLSLKRQKIVPILVWTHEPRMDKHYIVLV